MTADMLIVCALVLGVAILFATEKLRADLVALTAMSILILSGIITPQEGLSGFSSTATVTVGAMFVLSAAVFRTGAVNRISGWTIRAFKYNFWVGILVTMVLAGVLSAFVNNTPVVAIFIPILVGVAREIKRNPSRLLMPLSFASMFGGVCTLIGTSTNILLSSISVAYGHPPFGMFEFTALGSVFFVVGTAYMMLVGVRLIPDRRSSGDLTQQFGMGNYLMEIELLPKAVSVGQTIKRSRLVAELGLEVLELIRDGKRKVAPSVRTVLREHDLLRVVGDVTKIRQLEASEGIRLNAREKFRDEDMKGEDVSLVEAIIAPNSVLEGKSLIESRFRDRFGATALALLHRGRLRHTDISKVRLKAGDALLLEGSNEGLDDLREEGAFVFLSEVGVSAFRKEKMIPALLIACAVIISAAAGFIPIVVSALAGCVLMILAGCITLEEAYTAVDWKVVFLLGGILPLGIALEKTGTAALISDQLIAAVGDWGPMALIAVFYLLTSVLTELMSNNATAVLLAPIAFAAASALGIDPRPLLMTVTFAASASFMTPVGYQTNTMIYGAGQYRFSDFMRVGAPLNLIFWILATILIPSIWPF